MRIRYLLLMLALIAALIVLAVNHGSSEMGLPLRPEKQTPAPSTTPSQVPSPGSSEWISDPTLNPENTYTDMSTFPSGEG